jgi:hypothetical protein
VQIDCIEYTSSWTGFKLITLVVIDTDCTGSCKFNYHMIATTTVPVYNILIFFSLIVVSPTTGVTENETRMLFWMHMIQMHGCNITTNSEWQCLHFVYPYLLLWNTKLESITFYAFHINILQLLERDKRLIWIKSNMFGLLKMSSIQSLLWIFIRYTDI